MKRTLLKTSGPHTDKLKKITSGKNDDVTVVGMQATFQGCPSDSTIHSINTPTSARPKPADEQRSVKDRTGQQINEILKLEDTLINRLSGLKFTSKSITHVYNPLIYAQETHTDYVKKFGGSKKDILFLGMNPGPFGMAQNGVPFGECHAVKNWMCIEGHVTKPALENSHRPILGLANNRSEVSGARLWGLFQEVSESPSQFFSQCYVHNYCPLVFMTATGRNVTPPDLNVSERNKLQEICDKSLAQMFLLLAPKVVVAIGKFAFDRSLIARDIANQFDPASGLLGADRVESHADDAPTPTTRWNGECRIELLLHPSPANPQSNRGGGWKVQALERIKQLGLLEYLKNIDSR